MWGVGQGRGCGRGTLVAVLWWCSLTGGLVVCTLPSSYYEFSVPFNQFHFGAILYSCIFSQLHRSIGTPLPTPAPTRAHGLHASSPRTAAWEPTPSPPLLPLLVAKAPPPQNVRLFEALFARLCWPDPLRPCAPRGPRPCWRGRGGRSAARSLRLLGVWRRHGPLRRRVKRSRGVRLLRRGAVSVKNIVKREDGLA